MIKETGKPISLLILTWLLLLSSCNSNVMYTDSFVVPEKKWDLADIKKFSVDVKDTVTSNNIFFVLRTGSSYPFRNIHLFVSTTSPGGKTITDTLQYFLADEKGNRYGKGFGDIRELELPYKQNVYFPVRGPYQFKIQHGMRTEDLEGVYDVGLRIEKVRK